MRIMNLLCSHLIIQFLQFLKSQMDIIIYNYQYKNSQAIAKSLNSLSESRDFIYSPNKLISIN